MVAGHTQEKRGYFYIVLNYKDSAGEPKPTAPAMAVPHVADWRRAVCGLYAELAGRYQTLRFAGDLLVVLGNGQGHYRALFQENRNKLSALKPRDIQAFYDEKIKTVSANTVIHYHANIHKALDMAVKLELITSNPSDHVEMPKKNRFVGNFYNSDELNELFVAAKGTKLELPILFGAFYGLRRSEAVGLRWEAIDFENNTITIRHTVTTCRIDGKKVMVAADRTKNKSSMRTLPLVPFFKERLLCLQDQQNKQRKLCGGSYCRDFRGYICVDEMGVLIKPDYISAAFPKLLDRHGLRRIRFHDLRHSCASLLLAHGVPMKQIQEWLGHSDFSTTANIYSHLDYTAKLNSAETLVTSLDFALEPKLLPG